MLNIALILKVQSQIQGDPGHELAFVVTDLQGDWTTRELVYILLLPK